MRNFKPGFIDGSRNMRVSSFKDHAASDMHCLSYAPISKESSTSAMEYAPIARALHNLDPASEAILCKKFEV